MAEIKDIRMFLGRLLQDGPWSELNGAGEGLPTEGKMLRAQLTLYAGTAAGTTDDQLIRAGAAVELVHAASLLHDDVIDGGELRRGRPAFWKQHGISGAVLTGDLLVFEAFSVMQPLEDLRLYGLMVETGLEVCRAEVKQELVSRGKPGSWAECWDIARRKTGALFAFAAAAGAPPEAELLFERLKEVGYRIGTAYQLADDFLDVGGNPVVSGKTVGLDALRGKITAASVRCAPEIVRGEIEQLLESSIELLQDFPAVQKAVQGYLRKRLLPLVWTCFSSG